MFHQTMYQGTLTENYETVLLQLKGLTDGESDLIANLSNAAALLNHFLDDINWVGFYLAKGQELVLGPFQGLPACIRIPFHKGVCGHAATTKQTVVVSNVHEFPGHIACDEATNSEIVIPLIKDDQLIGVLDIDSPVLNRFSEMDKKYLEQFVQILINTMN
ncbi:GAF domain-containing protein [Turicibacter sp. TJ11]|uniref:GAF domain-containing protein n=1 Tax=Turicibacter sp. TJ11 TaxID=2806443 RepID=UPI001F1C46D8|nr:GAF domain-containing protein [Turicibacter sp. TJ11]